VFTEFGVTSIREALIALKFAQSLFTPPAPPLMGAQPEAEKPMFASEQEALELIDWYKRQVSGVEGSYIAAARQSVEANKRAETAESQLALSREALRQIAEHLSTPSNLNQSDRRILAIARAALANPGKTEGEK
jgi:hypothetical protein